MKIFITGATGFVGRELIEKLSKTEHELHCLVRKTSDATHLEAAGARLAIGDVTDKDSIRQGMKGCQWVIHLANLYSFWEIDGKIFERVNIEGTRNVMECAIETGASKVVHVSTCATYGCPRERPFTEESEPGPPLSEYARTKRIGDEIVRKLRKERGLPVVILLPAPILGAGDSKATGQYVGNLIHKKLPATMLEETSMTFVHVKDVAEGILRAAEKEENLGEEYLLGKHQLSIREMNELVRDLSGVSLPIMTLPDFLVMPTAELLTITANLFKIPPLWGMSVDQVRTSQKGIHFDGAKAERELGLAYASPHDALRDMVEEEMSQQS
uniref:Dihydroflavonol-4-reductase n=1 Tax=Candidatus Kentrum sp. SD TaxID=2126332 RepID=A0A451BIH4_9GAMM|nr:MAG: dihydroflavonol-4-reductase [Candidatus Kentron sp. SD]